MRGKARTYMMKSPPKYMHVVKSQRVKYARAAAGGALTVYTLRALLGLT